MISGSEKAFIERGVEQDIRNDGRGRLDYRSVDVDCAVLPQAYGSARVTVGKDAVGGCGTDVLAVVKAEIMTPTVDRPSEGEVVVSVDCAPSLFLGVANRRDAKENLNAELSGAVQRVVDAALPLQSLCFMKGRFAWRIFLDAMVLHGDGNVSDVLCMAVWVALQTAQLPEVNPIEAEAGFDDDFDLNGSPEKAHPLEVSKLPVMVTFTRVGEYFVVDATGEEERCGSAQVHIAVNRQKEFCGVYQVGITTVPLQHVPQLMESAVNVAGSIMDGLSAATARSLGSKKEFPDVPVAAKGFL